MFSKIFTAATLALVVCFGSTQKAQAAPIFLLPDVNFVTHGDGLVVVSPSNYTVNVNTALGDMISQDSGTGFSALSNTTISAQINGEVGALVLNMGGELGQSMSATLISSHMTNTALGKDVFDVFRVTSSSWMGFKVGALVGLDMLAYNGITVNGVREFQIKGDVAPIVPEPATISLLVLGLSGLAASARKKLLV